MELPSKLLLAFLHLFLVPILCFEVDMIHRDSPLSPLYDPSITNVERARRAVESSFTRQRSLYSSFRSLNSTSRRSFKAPIHADDYGYIMRISLGTRRFPIWAIVDTGSTLTWTQCYPCQGCYRQKARPYDPRNSKSYRLARCTDPQCQGAGFLSCGYGSRCNYLYGYGDGSQTAGNLATDRVSFLSTRRRRSVSFSRIYIGCGYVNGGTFSSMTSGIVGLANSPLSVTNQLNVKTFSYCLPEMFSDARSEIIFGPKGKLRGKGVVSTPLITESSYENPFYYFTFTGFRVGSTEIKSIFANQTGNTIIDSGTTLTFLPYDVVDGMVTVLNSKVKCQRNRTAEDEIGLDLCYNIRSQNCDLTLPPIVAQFDGGDLELPESNTFIEVEDGVKCLTIVGTYFVSIWGNTAQMNFKTEYDLANKKLKFLPADCSK